MPSHVGLGSFTPLSRCTWDVRVMTMLDNSPPPLPITEPDAPMRTPVRRNEVWVSRTRALAAKSER